MQQLIQLLDGAQGNDSYSKAARAFDSETDLDVDTAHLRVELKSFVTSFETRRSDRLRAAPLDEERMALVRRRMSEVVMAHGPGLTCFRRYNVRRNDSGTLTASEVEFGLKCRQFPLMTYRRCLSKFSARTSLTWSSEICPVALSALFLLTSPRALLCSDGA